MKTSLSWLKNYVDLDLEINDLSEILTTIGLEVEGVEEVEMIEGGLKGVVVGHVKTCEKHPDADKLSLTTVNVGGESDLQIVCGAPNVGPGKKVLVATIGTTLYNDDKPWKIKKGKIRGQVSEGMICAEDELGLGASHDGVMILPEDTVVGTPAAEYFNIESDVVFDIGLTPNRSDATSHLGVAKDLHAYLKINHGLTKSVKEPDINGFSVEYNSFPIGVEVRDKVACPRYSGLTLSNVKVGESPEWMQNHLKAIGVRPISNIVDITNYVLHELGQPLHAFDADKISGKKIIVKKAEPGEKFLSLDEKERTLNEEDLMICDGDEKPMCIAGVFGGLNSGVTDETVNIFLESAHFEAGNTRRTSTRHLLRTDAAKVFEKGSDPNITVFALKRAAQLMVEYCDATISSEIVDVYPTEIKAKEINLSYAKVNRLIGADISRDEIHNILRAMEMEINPINDDQIKVSVPTNKADVIRDVDLIEEILRIYGFNKIEIPTKVSSTLSFTEFPSKRKIIETTANFLSSIGYNEMMGLSLIESKKYEDNYPLDEKEFVYINNTSNIHLDIMRPELMVSGLLSVLHNHNRQQLDLRLFEFGKSYIKTEEDFKETEFLTLFVSGKRRLESWRHDFKPQADFFDIKKTVNNTLGRLGISGYQVSELEDPRLAYGLKYHRGQSNLAIIGEVDATILNKLGIKNSVFYAEIPLKMMVKSAKSAKNTVKKISKFPSIRRDLALVVDKGVKFENIQKLAVKADKKLLKEINLFDVYTNEEHVGKGKKSYAISFQFEDNTKTLNDSEIDKVMKKLIGSFTHQLGAVIRE
ncbi:MAG: phenylalanine--tRNA ligase subunit beta [Saprospiraceae bacterium]|nr:phenylalanine--tRNA ligase subunit beta [Saprospiraceae bacterium]